MAELITQNFDAAEYLTTPDLVREYLQACLDEGDLDFFIQALGDAARSEGMSKIAKEAGLGRESLYKAFGKGKHPRFETVYKVLNALDMRIRIE
ncbi:probable addiction module antidote protein [Marinospirillum celere]|uniref:Probable addiction module antidote protein n=1 Tax=Marinospirillum celere TaxID=1122252 RepID=A0A1I1EEH6_9GAMM|nr:addiction module antidote protein [Marinospirillum celere]SFB83333.1 probable addiction module antidote protein [Marinospirillum celere]